MRKDQTDGAKSDRATFDDVFCGLLPRLYRRAVMFSGSRQLAEDAVHEAYLKLANRPERLLAHPEPYAYAFSALMSAVRDAYRREKRQVLIDDVETHTAVRTLESGGTHGGAFVDAAWDGGLERRQGEWEAMRLLSRLSPRQAGVVILVDLDGYTIDQAAKIMKVHRGTAARHRARALDSLRGMLVEAPDPQTSQPGRRPEDGRAS
ncbi:RNA polymerase sigma factor [Streptomyces sp. NPDC059037]|uniref:RNA polymerase sigma factor n=1 Tax=Streptomyces sp. NPDC059037 TaxID=3346710 RepID=UPI003686E528